ncbi:MAG: 2-succinyl-5-enolpyruvyl-6-hydroxy-3-cyclohexene-1-carboxylic-acid synthase [Polyangiales bacterium]
MTASNLHIAWSELFARALSKSGVRHVVVSPGSRSTPLVLGMARVGALTLHSVIDERSAGFFALGIARLTAEPVAVLCTSGTAAAHYLPAVMEASLARLPLVVITADRPWDAYDCMAPQTVDQVKLYGSYVRHYAELGLPDVEAFSAVTRVASQSVLRSMVPDAGPVHINARFRKPLEPQNVTGEEPWQRAWDRAVAGIPEVNSCRNLIAPAVEALTGVVQRLHEEPRLMFACGPALTPPFVQEWVRSSLAQIGAPVLVEATSNLRFQRSDPHAPMLALRSVEALCSSRLWRQKGPKVVVELGLPMVSTAYARWASDPNNEVERLVFAPAGYSDPSSNATIVMAREGEAVLYRWSETANGERAMRAPFATLWSDADQRAQRAVGEELAEPSLSEGATIAAVHESLADESVVIVGNSSAVRDIDAYAVRATPSVTVLHQRGASGIDGLVAGAVGTRTVSKKPVVLILGDVSLWHDVGSLQLARSVTEPLVIVVLQNRGGRIFDRLPLGSNKDLRAEYERLFLTDRAQSFEAVSRSFGLSYESVTTAGQVREAMKRALAHGGATVIESQCAPGNAERFAALVRKGAAAVDSL